MAGNIKGITIEIGGNTLPLQKGLDQVNKTTKNLQTELQSVNRLLKLDPGNAELLAQKQKLLAQQVENSREKMLALKKTQEQVNAAFEKGDLGEEQYRHFSRQVINAEQDLNKFESQLKHVGAAAGQTKKDLAELGSKVEGVGSKMSMGITLPVVGGAIALTEGTREDRQDLGKLEAAFTTSNFSAEQAKKTYQEFYGILGETDTAIEAANLLTELAKSQEDLDKWVTISTGVYAKFGDALPIEGLIEASNETAKVGKVTGPLADALNWVGISEDKMNVSLAACTSEQERQALITEKLTGAYSGVAQKYREVNGTVIEANTAHAELGNQLADLANKIEPVVTKVVKALSGLLDMFNSLPGPVQNVILVIAGIAAALGPLLIMVGKAMIIFQLLGGKFTLVAKVGEVLAGFFPKLGQIVFGLVGKINPVIAIITTLMAVFGYLYTHNTKFKNWADSIAFAVKNAFAEMVNYAVEKINKLIELANNLPGVEMKAINKVSVVEGNGHGTTAHWATGTNYHPGGMAWVGEKGPELIDLPRSTKVYNAQQSRAMMGGSQTMNHTGVITVRGVNDMGGLVGYTRILTEELQRDMRGIPTRVARIPSRA